MACTYCNKGFTSKQQRIPIVSRSGVFYYEAHYNCYRRKMLKLMSQARKENNLQEFKRLSTQLQEITRLHKANGYRKRTKDDSHRTSKDPFKTSDRTYPAKAAGKNAGEGSRKSIEDMEIGELF